MPDQCLRSYLEDFALDEETQECIYHTFCDGIEHGLDKDTNCRAEMQCYLTYIQDLPNGTEKGKCLGVDLGSENMRVIMLTLNGDEEPLENVRVYEIPDEILHSTSVKFFDYVTFCLDCFVKTFKVDKEVLPMGLTFSFPCMQQGLASSILAHWTKGFCIPDTVQKDIGQLLKYAIRRREGLQVKLVAILNETSGTLVSCVYRNPECRIGVIAGAWTNACYIEKVEAVGLLPKEYAQKPFVVVNTEWGGFGDAGSLDFIRTCFDYDLDKETDNKGSQIFEKMVGGLYLGELFRLVLIGAVKENLIFKCCSERKLILRIVELKRTDFTTSAISDIICDNVTDFPNTKYFLRHTFGIEEGHHDDCDCLRYICEVVSKRAAILTGLALSGLINRIEGIKVTVGMDGSLYRRHPTFTPKIREVLHRYVPKDKEVELLMTDDGAGRGAALLAAVSPTDPPQLSKPATPAEKRSSLQSATDATETPEEATISAVPSQEIEEEGEKEGEGETEKEKQAPVDSANEPLLAIEAPPGPTATDNAANPSTTPTTNEGDPATAVIDSILEGDQLASKADEPETPGSSK